ncbi:MAG: helix-hairpin-helix domain-containing protein [Rhodospirillales bacterium]|nr:helix-hairpin-helix domain-containing protein [Rhodospirillales bacterium]
MTVRISQAMFAATIAALLSPAAWAGPSVAHEVRVDQTRMQLAADQAQVLLDINSASEEDLRTLPGVGPARAQAIVAGRPYKGKDDLVKKNILPKNVYDGLKDRIVARQK